MVRNKAKQSTKKREDDSADSTNTWLDLPILLRNKIRRHHSSHSESWAAKSWKMSPKRCPAVGNSTSLLPQLCETIDHDDETGGYISGYQIPIWDAMVPYKQLALSYSNHDNFVWLVLTGISKPAFVYYKRTGPWDRIVGNHCYKHFPEEHKWVTEDCTIIDPHCSSQRYMQFCNAVGLDGKFYALSLQGTLAVIEEVDSRMVITNVSKTRAVPSVFSRHFMEYLTESCGEILLIFLISTKSTTAVDDVEIFCLQISRKLWWKKVESLGDRVVVAGAGTCCIVDRRELRCKGNCVYFTNRGSHGWWVYDMARGDITRGTWRRDVEDFSHPCIPRKKVVEDEDS